MMEASNIDDKDRRGYTLEWVGAGRFCTGLARGTGNDRDIEDAAREDRVSAQL